MLARQVAALPLRWDKKGKLKVLLVTSRGTGRWVMPKGWCMDGKKNWRAAEIEALEEAGVVGEVSEEPLGTFRYGKRLDNGKTVTVKVELYPMLVGKLKRSWKERKQRERRWFSPSGAARRVDEPQLEELLRGVARKPGKLGVLKDLLKAS